MLYTSFDHIFRLSQIGSGVLSDSLHQCKIELQFESWMLGIAEWRKRSVPWALAWTQAFHQNNPFACCIQNNPFVCLFLIQETFFLSRDGFPLITMQRVAPPQHQQCHLSVPKLLGAKAFEGQMFKIVMCIISILRYTIQTTSSKDVDQPHANISVSKSTLTQKRHPNETLVRWAPPSLGFQQSTKHSRK